MEQIKTCKQKWNELKKSKNIEKKERKKDVKKNEFKQI